jgi:hypothetical protein
MKRSRHLISNLSLSPIKKRSWLENIQVYTHEKGVGIIAIEPSSSSAMKPLECEEDDRSKLLSLRHRRLQLTKYFYSRRRWLLYCSTFLLLATLLVASILLMLGSQSLAGWVGILIGGVATIGMASLNIWLDK